MTSQTANESDPHTENVELAAEVFRKVFFQNLFPKPAQLGFQRRDCVLFILLYILYVGLYDKSK